MIQLTNQLIFHMKWSISIPSLSDPSLVWVCIFNNKFVYAQQSMYNLKWNFPVGFMGLKEINFLVYLLKHTIAASSRENFVPDSAYCENGLFNMFNSGWILWIASVEAPISSLLVQHGHGSKGSWPTHVCGPRIPLYIISTTQFQMMKKSLPSMRD